MIDTLAKILRRFPGRANHVRCLAHIVNLVAKVILRRFDARKKQAKDGSDVYDVGEELPDDEAPDEDEFADLMKDADKEEKEMDDGDGEDGVDMEDDITEVEAVMREEIKNAAMATQPVRHVLYKVSLFA
jgi:hypothetical protein